MALPMVICSKPTWDHACVCLPGCVCVQEAELHQAWDLYYHVFKRINKQLPSLTTLDLQYVAPALVRAQASGGRFPGLHRSVQPCMAEC